MLTLIRGDNTPICPSVNTTPCGITVKCVRENGHPGAHHDTFNYGVQHSWSELHDWNRCAHGPYHFHNARFKGN